MPDGPCDNAGPAAASATAGMATGAGARLSAPGSGALGSRGRAPVAAMEVGADLTGVPRAGCGVAWVTDAGAALPPATGRSGTEANPWACCGTVACGAPAVRANCTGCGRSAAAAGAVSAPATASGCTGSGVAAATVGAAGRLGVSAVAAMEVGTVLTGAPRAGCGVAWVTDAGAALPPAAGRSGTEAKPWACCGTVACGALVVRANCTGCGRSAGVAGAVSASATASGCTGSGVAVFTVGAAGRLGALAVAAMDVGTALTGALRAACGVAWVTDAGAALPPPAAGRSGTEAKSWACCGTVACGALVVRANCTGCGRSASAAGAVSVPATASGCTGSGVAVVTVGAAGRLGATVVPAMEVGTVLTGAPSAGCGVA